MLQISIFVRQRCIKQIDTADENHKMTKTTEPTQNNHLTFDSEMA